MGRSMRPNSTILWSNLQAAKMGLCGTRSEMEGLGHKIHDSCWITNSPGVTLYDDIKSFQWKSKPSHGVFHFSWSKQDLFAF